MRRAVHRSPARQRGVLSLLFALLLPVLLCVIGMALDLSLLYQQKSRLQNLADAAALAAARSLDGTAAGVGIAADQARIVAEQQSYQGSALSWKPAALTFSASPDTADAAWVDAAGAAAAPAGLAYAKVDTRELDASLVNTVFLRMAGVARQVSMAGRAVAGRARAQVTPLAICAMGAASSTRINPGAASTGTGAGAQELVTYGFRYGVSYNLLKLNAGVNTSTAEYFLVDPFQYAGPAPGPVQQTGDAVLAPFMCSGTVQLPRVTGAALRLRRPAGFTLGEQLNSRFGVYGAGALACVPATAPPDTNVREFGTASAATWMVPPPAGPSAQPAAAASGQKYNTVADRATGPDDAAKYGPLWTYGPAKQAAGGAAILRSQWPFLYPVTAGPVPSAPAYTATAPYFRTSGSYFLPPSQPSLAGRRVLTIPLLQCPVAPGADTQAVALALGRFLMTAQADSDGVYGEFIGVANENDLGGGVELYR
jgi:Flp pilus assembly protein TadG